MTPRHEFQTTIPPSLARPRGATGPSTGLRWEASQHTRCICHGMVRTTPTHPGEDSPTARDRVPPISPGDSRSGRGRASNPRRPAVHGRPCPSDPPGRQRAPLPSQCGASEPLAQCRGLTPRGLSFSPHLRVKSHPSTPPPRPTPCTDGRRPTTHHQPLITGANTALRSPRTFPPPRLAAFSPRDQAPALVGCAVAKHLKYALCKTPNVNLTMNAPNVAHDFIDAVCHPEYFHQKRRLQSDNRTLHLVRGRSQTPGKDLHHKFSPPPGAPHEVSSTFQAFPPNDPSACGRRTHCHSSVLLPQPPSRPHLQGSPRLSAQQWTARAIRHPDHV